jgi:drug/metabolite transporter (DMT)-like permease
MIQRIQSIWLLLAGTSSMLTLKFSFFTAQKDGIRFSLNTASEFYLIIIAVGIFLSAFISIFLFRNRKRQSSISIIGLLTSLLLNGFFLYAYFKNCYNIKDAVIALSAIIYFSIPVFFVLALLAIRKDERLIKSMDRLR